MSLGDVDTLTLTFDKLRYISSSYDQYDESFAQLITLYKSGKMGEKEYQNLIIDSVLKYSALEFLALRGILEIKKAINRNESGKTIIENTESQSSHSLSSFFIAKNLPEKTKLELNHNKINCLKCGIEVKSTAKFCTSCGNYI